MHNFEQSVIYNKRDYYFEHVNQIAAGLGFCFHVFMLGYFLYLEVWEMFYFNFFSIIFYGTAYLINRKQFTYVNIIFIIGSVEVAFHAYLGTLFLGVESGLNLFVWLVPVVIMVKSKLPTKWIIFTVIATALAYIGTIIIGNLLGPVYTLSDQTLKLTGQFSVLLCAIVVLTIAIYFNVILKRKESFIVREIHHRVRNNLQLISSIANLQKYAVQNEDCSGLIDKLKKRIRNIGLVHRQLGVNTEFITVDLRNYFITVIRDEVDHHVDVEFSVDRSFLGLDNALPVAMIFSEVLQNFVQHGLSEGATDQKLSVNFRLNESGYTLIMKHNGALLPPDWKADEMGTVGLSLISALAEQLEGEMSYHNHDDEVTFSLTVQ